MIIDRQELESALDLRRQRIRAIAEQWAVDHQLTVALKSCRGRA